jgi:cyclopropane fatty-acyl-phospholipid synthase-like methyltransferase
MDKFSEAEIQLLVVIGNFRSRYNLMMGLDLDAPASAANLRAFGETWIGRYLEDLEDWQAAFDSLIERGLIEELHGAYGLTADGEQVTKTIERVSPLWLYEYDNFYFAAADSRAHSLLCREVYGEDLSQHGLADLDQLNSLIAALDLKAADHVLDAGCGNGRITEYLHRRTGASFLGIDLSREAIKQANHIATDKLRFQVGNLNDLALPARSFDAVISIDTLYYVENLESTVARLVEALKPAGRLAAFFSQWVMDVSEVERLQADHTDLAGVLAKLGLEFETIDLTREHVSHWAKKLAALERLKPEFEREGNLKLYEYRFSEASRYSAWDSEKTSRYLYTIKPG